MTFPFSLILNQYIEFFNEAGLSEEGMDIGASYPVGFLRYGTQRLLALWDTKRWIIP